MNAALPLRSLWRNSAFVLLWIAQTISTLGSRLTATATPLTTALTLDATAELLRWLEGGGEVILGCGLAMVESRSPD